jgi:hypothetical protein
VLFSWGRGGGGGGGGAGAAPPRYVTARFDNPTCERCLEEDELATHILCDCEAIAY